MSVVNQLKQVNINIETGKRWRKSDYHEDRLSALKDFAMAYHKFWNHGFGSESDLAKRCEELIPECEDCI